MKYRPRGIWKCDARSFTVVAGRREAGLGAGVRAGAPGCCQGARAGRRQWRGKGPRRAWERGRTQHARHSTPAGRLTGVTDTREATAGGAAPGKLRADRCEGLLTCAQFRPEYAGNENNGSDKLSRYR